MNGKQNSGRDARRQEVLSEEAAAWIVELQEPGPSSKEAFANWLRLSPEHIREFLVVKSMWDDLTDIPDNPSVEELVALATAEQSVVSITPNNVSDMPNKPTPHSASRNWKWLAAASVAAFALVSSLLMWPATKNQIYHTEVGEQTSVPLPDGTIVTLNTRTTLKVMYSDGFRDVQLVEGEALFEVAKDKTRPFRVFSQQAIAQAVGTQFNVRKEERDTTVTVVEGIVDVNIVDTQDKLNLAQSNTAQTSPTMENAKHSAVKPVRLTVGQEARVNSQAQQIEVVNRVAVNAISWKERRLVFEAETLKKVVEEFNRYNDNPLRIKHPSLESLKITGVFHSNDRASFVAFLLAGNIARVQTLDNGTILLLAPAKS
ncbi:FecR family protein [Neptunicella sp. SCSIO 80796]|uniref:FecR family protein n=1 Tax=Neptunicella plasticusilytica TaxID=3117012 RepID=UPI003A4D864C